MQSFDYGLSSFLFLAELMRKVSSLIFPPLTSGKFQEAINDFLSLIHPSSQLYLVRQDDALPKMTTFSKLIVFKWNVLCLKYAN